MKLKQSPSSYLNVLSTQEQGGNKKRAHYLVLNEIKHQFMGVSSMIYFNLNGVIRNAKVQEEPIVLQSLKAYIEQSGWSGRSCFVYYDGHLLLGLSGGKRDTKYLVVSLQQIISNMFGIPNNVEEMKISSNGKILFLKYEIIIFPRNLKKVSIRIPKHIVLQQLIHLKAIRILSDGKWKPLHRGWLVHKSDVEILAQYNKELKLMWTYYKSADNLHALRPFYEMMKYSLMKTYAAKYRSSVHKMFKQFSINGSIGVRHKEEVLFLWKPKY